jgi:NDP-sugar pyrophosphorylase family protein
MPSILSTLVEMKREVAVFPIREYWIDIGQMDDFQRANGDFPKVFQ